MSQFITSTSIVTTTALSVGGLSGGTNGKVVRISGTNTVTDASNTDTTSQLNTVMIKLNNIYYSGGVVTGFTDLSPGAPYFLGTAGSIIATPPTPTTSVRVLYLGFAINTTDLIFRPGIPIVGTAAV
jgi:hypothetical protein